MIPLTLRLIEQEVQPEGQVKLAWVLFLEPTYFLVETQKYAQTPPEQVLILPPPDTEAPDDLFPKEILKQSPRPEAPQPAEDRLINLWDRAKSKVWHLDIQDYQIARYFMKYFQMQAGIKDFESALPPEKFTAEQLSCFLEDVERYTQE